VCSCSCWAWHRRRAPFRKRTVRKWNTDGVCQTYLISSCGTSGADSASSAVASMVRPVKSDSVSYLPKALATAVYRWAGPGSRRPPPDPAGVRPDASPQLADRLGSARARPPSRWPMPPRAGDTAARGECRRPTPRCRTESRQQFRRFPTTAARISGGGFVPRLALTDATNGSASKLVNGPRPPSAAQVGVAEGMSDRQPELARMPSWAATCPAH
jgi:hypothetical protein